MSTFRVFHTTYKDRRGRTRQAAKWYVEFRDHLDTVRRLPAFTSKSASEEMGRNLVKLVGYFRGTGGQLDPALTGWLATLPQQTRESLVRIGLLDRERLAGAKPLADHLDDWRAALVAKDDSERHVELVFSRVAKVLDGCGFQYHGDISASKVLAFLHDLRTDAEGKRGIGPQTFNFYLSHLKQFCRWMVRDRRAAESPVDHLDPLNVKTDRRHDRRALTVDELVRLLETTYTRPASFDLTGPERSLIYWLATETGLRSGELRSLTPESFALDADPPTVTVAAGYSKRRRLDTLPLRAELVEALRGHLAGNLPKATAFPLPERQHVIDLFRADVEAAGIPYTVDGPDGPLFADFHCLRHTFISNLANGGVHPKVAQALARHSTITLTMDRYSHTLLGEQSQALEALPNLQPGRTLEGARATGTDGRDLASCLALSERFQETSGGAGRLKAATDSEGTSEQNSPDLQYKRYESGDVSSGEGGIIAINLSLSLNRLL